MSTAVVKKKFNLRRAGLLILITVLVLLVFIAATISIALSTTSGSRWVVNQISDRLSNETVQLSIEETEGALLWGLHLRGIRYSSLQNGTENFVEITELRSRWNPMLLTVRQFTLESLFIDELNVVWHSGPATESSNEDPFAGILPLPVNVRLTDASLQSMQINFDDSFYAADSLAFTAELNDRSLTLSELVLDGVAVADGTLTLTAELRVELIETFPLEGDLQWEFSGTLFEDIDTAAGALNIQGDTKSLNLSHQLTAPFELHSIGVVDLAQSTPAGDPTSAPNLDLTHTLQQSLLPFSQLRDYQFSTLVLRTSGWTNAMKISGNTNISSAALAPMEISLDTQWRDEFLFINSLRIDSGTGGITSNGRIGWENGLAVDFDYILNENNPGSFFTTLPEGLELGPLASSGNVRLRTENEVLQGSFSIDTFDGLLNQYPITANGSLDINGTEFTINDFFVQTGDNSIQIAGTYAESIDLQFDIDTPALNTLYNGASGSILASGSVTGTIEEPRITLDGQASNVVFNDLSVNSVQLQADYNNLTTSANFQMQGLQSGEDDNAILVESIVAELSGQPEDHAFSLSVISNLVSAQIQAAGGMDAGIWSGSLLSGLIESAYGNWRLSDAVELTLAADQVTMPTQCWQQNQNRLGELCYNADWTPASLNAQLDLTNFPLAIFNAEDAVSAVYAALLEENPQLPELVPVYFPELDIPTQLPANMAISGAVNAAISINGILSADPAELNIRADLNMGEGALFVNAATMTEDAEFSVADADGQPAMQGSITQFTWPTANVQAERTENNWELRGVLEFFQQSVEDTGIDMRGSISSLVQIDAQENLDAQLDLVFDDLNFIEAFVPQLQNTQGGLSSRILIGGTLDAPEFSGDLLMENAATDIPALGIELRNLQTSLSSSDGNSVQVSGRIDSGEGTLNFESQIDNPLQESRQITVTVTGNDFQLADIPEMVLTASPDLRLVASSEGIDVNGTLLLPQLNVEIFSLPESAVDVSGDTVIVQQAENVPAVRNAAQADRGILGDTPITGEIRLVLGEDVRFAGFGLTAQLEGALDINQRATGSPLTYGELTIVSGNYETYGQTLTIEHGKLLFFGTFDNPGLDIRAVREVENLKVGVQMNGTLRNIRSQLFSTPTLPDGEIIAVLLTGRPFSEIGNQDGNALVGAITTLGINQGQSLTDQVRNQLGLDTLSIASSGDTSDSSLMLGKYLTPKIFIRYAVGLFETQSILAIDYSITDRVKLEATSGQGQTIDLTYTVEQ